MDLCVTGGFSVMLQDHGGQSQIGYGLGRSDYQPGVYSQVGIRNYDGVVVRGSPAPYLLRGVNCRVKLLYHAEGYVRFSFRDGSGVVWDTGEIPTYRPMRFDQLRFEVVLNSGQVEWRSGQGAMYLEGGGISQCRLCHFRIRGQHLVHHLLPVMPAAGQLS